jgi:hypothetical protein
MPVRKFRTVDELNQPIWRQPGDPAPYRTIASLWQTARAMRPRRFTPGVRRFRTIADLEAYADSAGDSVTPRKGLTGPPRMRAWCVVTKGTGYRPLHAVRLQRVRVPPR